jgi:hypothetical protein
VADVVEIVLALRNVRQLLGGAERAADTVEGVGTTTARAGRRARIGWRSIVGWAGAAGAVYGASRFAQGALGATETLGRSTLALSRTTGLDAETSSAWASVLQARGVDTTLFQRGLVKFSREIERTRAGTAGHDSALEQLGFSTSDVSIRSGETEGVLLRVSDALSKLRNPAERAALAQTLFGRQGLQLAPLLFKGRQAIEEQLALARRYGATLTGKSAKAISELMQRQRELRLAYLGVQLQLGQALLPITLKLSQAAVTIARAASPLTRNSALLAVALGLLAAAFLAYQLSLLQAAIASLGFDAASLTTLAIVAGIVVAALVLGAGLYLLARHWRAIERAMLGALRAMRGAVERVLAWTRDNWPLLLVILLGPFGLALALIVTRRDRIVAAGGDALGFLGRQWRRLRALIESIPGRLLGGLGRAGGSAGRALDLAAPALPGMQQGGAVSEAGGVLVGERGPELVSLPARATITRLPESAPGSLPGADLTGFGEAVITARLLLEGTREEFARASGRYQPGQGRLRLAG